MVCIHQVLHFKFRKKPFFDSFAFVVGKNPEGLQILKKVKKII